MDTRQVTRNQSLTEKVPDMTLPLVKDLRRAIDEQHQEALQALAAIRCYLEQPSLCRTCTERLSEQPALTGNGPSIRERVLEQIREQSRSVRDIEATTGLTKRQVRGVISAPDLKDRIERTSHNGTVHYRYVGDGDGEVEKNGRDRGGITNRGLRMHAQSN